MANILMLLLWSALVISVPAHPTPEVTSESTSPSNVQSTPFSLESSTSPVTQTYPTETPEISSEDDPGDMTVAETIVFRPLFRYRHDSAERRWGSSRHNYRNHWGSRPSYTQ